MQQSDPTKSLVPIPDPTLLTTQALTLSIQNLKELLEQKIESTKMLLEERIQHNYLMDEKRHRETREWIDKGRLHRLEIKEDAEKALEHALTAAKELSDHQRICNEESQIKSERSFTKQIEAMTNEFKLGRSALSDRITTLKEQLDKGVGKHEQHTEHRASSQWMIGLLVTCTLSLITNAITLIIIFTHISK